MPHAVVVKSPERAGQESTALAPEGGGEYPRSYGLLSRGLLSFGREEILLGGWVSFLPMRKAYTPFSRITTLDQCCLH